jgi:DNA-binding winged helix-turn-helix (wHTH) protein
MANNSSTNESVSVCFAGFALNRQRAELRGPDGRIVKLRPKTFTLLDFFVTHMGRVLSKQELMEAVWPNVYVGDDSLFQCIKEIRTALGDDKRQMVKLVSGRGYLFAA